MSDMSYGSIFLNAALINNFVLAYFLGLCPFFGVSSKLETAARMGTSMPSLMTGTVRKPPPTPKSPATLPATSPVNSPRGSRFTR